jgi:hypothetical protein
MSTRDPAEDAVQIGAAAPIRTAWNSVPNQVLLHQSDRQLDLAISGLDRAIVGWGRIGTAVEARPAVLGSAGLNSIVPAR